MPSNPFAPPVHVPLPSELADKPALMAWLGLSQPELNKIRWYSRRMYHHFNIAKRSGSTRQITAPDKRLKYLQRKILPLLDQLYRVRHPVHGFVSGKSVKTNAESHLRRRYLLNIDIKNFFSTITQNRVVGLLESIGVSSEVAEVIGDVCCMDGRLPQGAPTSPVISNMVCFRLDRELMAFAKKARCIYTRYADDISLSSHQPMSIVFDGIVPSAGNLPRESLGAEIKNIFAKNGFELNEAKCHYADKHSRKRVTGITTNEILNVDRRYVRNLRSILYSVEKDGLASAQSKFSALGFSGDLWLHLRGKLEWIRIIKGPTDPVVRALIVRHNACFPTRAITVIPTEEEKRDRACWITENKNGQGTLFFLKGIGLITAAHCVDGLSTVEVFHPSKHSNTFSATVTHIDSHRDLVVLSHSVPSTEYFELTGSTCVVGAGDAIVAMGYPSWGYGDPLNVRPGVVSALTVKSGVGLIEVNQKLSPGMSGGPLLDATGQVIGIIHKGGPTEPRDFAVHIDVLRDWISAIVP